MNTYKKSVAISNNEGNITFVYTCNQGMNGESYNVRSESLAYAKVKKIKVANLTVEKVDEFSYKVVITKG